MQNSTNQNGIPIFRGTHGVYSEAERKHYDHVRALERQAWKEDKDLDLDLYLGDPHTIGRYRDYIWRRAEANKELDNAKVEAWERAQEELARKQAQQGQ